MQSIPQAVLEPLQAIVMASEGCRLDQYLDASGFPTIGWGHKVLPSDGIGQTISQETADRLLAQDLAVHYNQLLMAVPDIAQLDPGKQAALTDFVYNLGIGTLLHSSLPTLVANRDWAAVKTNLAEWVHASGKVLPGLVIRRQKEIQLIGE